MPDPKKPLGVTPGYVVHGARPEDPRPTQDAVNSLTQGGDQNALTDAMGNTINLGVVTDRDRATMKGLMDKASEGQMQRTRLSMRDVLGRRTRGYFDEFNDHLRSAVDSTPSTMGDVPLGTLIQQLQERAPQFAARLGALDTAAKQAIMSYLSYATGAGADPDARAALGVLESAPEGALTLNSLQKFYAAAGAQLP